VSATKDFQLKLVQFFADEDAEVLVLDRIDAWNYDIVSDDYSTLSPEDLNRVKNFSLFLMLSSALSVANYALRVRDNQTWSDVDRAMHSNFGVLMMMHVMTAMAQGQMSDTHSRQLVSRGSSFPDSISQISFDPGEVDDRVEWLFLREDFGSQASSITSQEARVDSVLSSAGGQFPPVAPENAPRLGRGCIRWVMGEGFSTCVSIAFSAAILAATIIELI
jgi:hypothetical protein